MSCKMSIVIYECRISQLQRKLSGAQNVEIIINRILCSTVAPNYNKKTLICCTYRKHNIALDDGVKFAIEYSYLNNKPRENKH